MTMLLMGLTEEQKVQVMLILLVILVIYGILYFIKMKYKDKIESCNNKIIKKIFEQV